MTEADVVANIVLFVVGLGVVAAVCIGVLFAYDISKGTIALPSMALPPLAVNDDDDEDDETDEDEAFDDVIVVTLGRGIPVMIVTTNERTNANERRPDAVRSDAEYERLLAIAHNLEGLIEVALRLQWNATEIRSHLRGTMADTSATIRKVKERIASNAPAAVVAALESTEEQRTIRVRDNGGKERVIAL